MRGKAQRMLILKGDAARPGNGAHPGGISHASVKESLAPRLLTSSLKAVGPSKLCQSGLHARGDSLWQGGGLIPEGVLLHGARCMQPGTAFNAIGPACLQTCTRQSLHRAARPTSDQTSTCAFQSLVATLRHARPCDLPFSPAGRPCGGVLPPWVPAGRPGGGSTPVIRRRRHQLRGTAAVGGRACMFEALHGSWPDKLQLGAACMQ